jgi:hypothetical protein
MNKVWVFLLALLLIACTENRKEEGKKAGQAIAKPKFYGNPDMPQNDSLITSIGAGKVILGQDLNQIDLQYDSVQNIKIYMDGVEWPGKKILLNKNEWIIAFSTNSVNQITSIRTNGKQFRTKAGNKIGMTFLELKSGDSLNIDNEDKAIILFKDDVEVKIDKLNENNFFRNKNQNIDHLNMNATITEFLIKCGDC